MTKSSDKNKEINGSLADHSGVTDLAQNQTAILVTNEQSRVEHEVSKAVLTENKRQQKRNSCSGQKVFSGLMIFLIYLVLQFLFTLLYLYLTS